MIRKRIIGFVVSVAAASVIMTGCTMEEPTITYKGTQMPVSEAEERIADELEVDNPDLDLEVDIMEESDE